MHAHLIHCVYMLPVVGRVRDADVKVARVALVWRARHHAADFLALRDGDGRGCIEYGLSERDVRDDSADEFLTRTSSGYIWHADRSRT